METIILGPMLCCKWTFSSWWWNVTRTVEM